MIDAGSLREVLVIEEAIEARNSVGEVVQAGWKELGRRRASVEQTSMAEAQQFQQTNATASFSVKMRYFAPLEPGMRLRWESRGNRLLYVSSVIERNNREEHEVYAEERT